MTSVHRQDISPIGRQVTPMGAGLFFYDLPGGELPHQQITFGLNKLAGWAVEVTARNFNHLEAFSQSENDSALRKPNGRAVEVAAHNLDKL